MKNIYLEEFIEISTKDLEDFKESWLLGMRNAPKIYPHKLEEAEWFEQFLAFLSLNNKT